MTQQEALSALFNNAARRPVDVNLGQVPLTPTIGRMGNYNVVVRDTPRDNSALELSRALSQLPQLLGQARNISAASGARQAEEITLEELETKVKNGDADAKGTMTWLGADKAYQELAYKRLADANITPTLTNISSEIDRMSHAELLKFNSPDDIKDHVQGRLVGSLDPGIMETIKGKPWMEIRHNRYMEAIVPEYVEKVNASIEGRKHEFKIKEAIAALETNFLAQAGINLEDIPTEQIDSVLAVSQEAKFDPSQMWLDNFQYALDFARSQGEASGLDRFQIEDTLIPALTAKYNMLVEDEHHSEADLLLEAMESGSLKINGRPINKSSAGMRLIQNAEARLERSLEADEGEFDQKKVDSYMLKEITRYNDARALSDFQTEDYEEYYRQQRADLDNAELGLSVREQLELSKFYDKEIARLRGSERIYENFSNPAKDKKKEEFHQTYETTQRTILKKGISVERARESSGLDPAEFNSMFLMEVKNQYEEVTGMVFRPETEHILFDAALQAEMSTVETYIDRPRGDLFLGSDSVNAGNVPNQTEFRQEVSETAQGFLDEALGKYFSSYAERMKAQNPPLSDEEAQKRREESASAEIAERHYKKKARTGEALLNTKGEITSKRIPGTEFYETAGSQGAVMEELFYPLDTTNETIKNKHGLKLLKENPLLKRLELMSGLEAEARRPARLRAVGKTLDQIYGTDVYDSELKRELELVRYSGISFGALMDGGREDGEYTLNTGMFGRLAPKADQRQVSWTIDYNKFENFSTAAATKERIFNLGAITRYKQQGKDDDFRRIYSALLKNSGISLEAFIQNQVKLAESVYGNLEE
jgi:hypothetical protein